jgi:hypothetical protein
MWVRFYGIPQFDPVWRWDISKQEEFAKVALDDDPEVQKRFALALETRLLGNMAQVELDKRVTTSKLARAVSQVRGRNRKSKKASPSNSQIAVQGGEDRIASFMGTDILDPKGFEVFEKVLFTTATRVSKLHDSERQRLRFALESLLVALHDLDGQEDETLPKITDVVHVNKEPLTKAS